MPQLCETVYRNPATLEVFHKLKRLIAFHFQRRDEGFFRIFFLPAFCFSNSLRFRVMSPP